MAIYNIILAIVGPLLLFAVLLWAFLRNKKSTPREIERTEQATRDFYRQEDRDTRPTDVNP